jgi:hypothetical protein
MASLKLISIGFVAQTCLAMPGLAQTETPATTSEVFDLNIIERRITETRFEAGTGVRLDSGDLRLQVGASVRAGTIDALLRGVTGHVTFRYSLDGVLRRVPRLTIAPDIR